MSEADSPQHQTPAAADLLAAEQKLTWKETDPPCGRLNGFSGEDRVAAVSPELSDKWFWVLHGRPGDPERMGEAKLDFIGRDVESIEQACEQADATWLRWQAVKDQPPIPLPAPPRYTVVYEGDPDGATILAGMTAPGRAVSVALGDVLAERAALAASPPQAETPGLDREALGDPFLAGHSGCEEGPHVKLIYETIAEATRAHDALAAFLRTHPPSDPAAPTEPCDCKIGDCKRITRRCLEDRS